MRKKITILFEGVHLSYSPTTIGLYDLLSKHFEVTIIAESPTAFDNKPLPGRRVVYRKRFTKREYKLNWLLFHLLAIFDRRVAMIKSQGFGVDTFYDFNFIRKQLAAEPADFIIAIDFRNLFYAQVLGKRAEFVSLEIRPDDVFYSKCDFGNIDSVIIQTRERYEHLFDGRRFKTFFVQNAPVYTPSPANHERAGLVYCGTAQDQFGFYHCLEFLRQFPEYSMNVKGAVVPKDRERVETEYRDLLSSGRLLIDEEYLDDAEVVDYLRSFRVGFCFYNFDYELINTFNYHSAPSGKMFKYMAAGVPVVGQRILGLKPVEEFDCGVLVDDLKPASIKEAVEKIEANFDYYSQNCLRAAAHYSFDKRVAPFIDYLTAK